MSRTKVVIADTSFLLNFINVDRVDILGALDQFDFWIPREVAIEIREPIQVARLDAAHEIRILRTIDVAGVRELEKFAVYRKRFGLGESACLASASENGYIVALDDKKARKIAQAEFGVDRILTTPGALLLAIRRGVMTVAEADSIKDELLQTYRFKMKDVASFSDLL
ncbi:MAG: hypothetical protein D6800_02425 [Candidatus Zixiibacteriota bacterium]|nr:MAG: hypothetical protein D6800_02425 [candidate division Zixibacteria bacterium]